MTSSHFAHSLNRRSPWQSKLCVALAALWIGSSLLNAPVSAAMFSASIDPTLYGNLDQANVPNIGGCACGPTSLVNSLVYLQQEAPSLYGDGTALVPYDDDGMPPTQADMAAVATILAGAGYMDTANNGGTFIEDFIFGKTKYIEEKAPGKTIYAAQVALQWRDGINNTGGSQPTHQVPKPNWVQDQTAATLDFIYKQIKAREDVEIFLEYDTGSSHYLTVTGIMYDDANNTGKLNFIDPLGGMAGTTNITGVVGGVIKIAYGGGASVYHAVSESPVPEPAAIALMLIALIGLCLARRQAMHR